MQGFWSKSSWGFPKGKVNEDEPYDLCAIREVRSTHLTTSTTNTVSLGHQQQRSRFLLLHFCLLQVYEETGFDISPLMDKEAYIEFQLHGQHSRLYLVPGVSRETKFAPKTRNEIKASFSFQDDASIETGEINRRMVISSVMSLFSKTTFVFCRALSGSKSTICQPPRKTCSVEKPLVCHQMPFIWFGRL